MLLEKILEEDSSYGDEYNRNPTPIGREYDKRYLLGNGHTGSGTHMTNI